MPERTREVTTVVGVAEVMAWVPKGSVPADQLVTDEQLRALPDCKANEDALREAPTQSHSDWQAYTRYCSATALDVTVAGAVKVEKNRLVGIWEEEVQKAGGCIVCRAMIAREKEPK